MRVFEMSPDEEYPYNYDFNAAHRYSLPGVKCDLCGWVGGSVGVAYPSVTLGAGVEPRPYLDTWPVAPGQLEILRRALRECLPKEWPTPPGTEFGPLEGKGFGRFGDFTWLNPWTPLISESAAAELRRVGVLRVPTVHPCISLRSRKPFRYCELEILASAELDPSFLPDGALEACGRCGLRAMHRMRTGWEKDPVVLASSLKGPNHLWRIVELEGHILASNDFVNAVRGAGFSDVRFNEVRVSP